MTTGIYSLTFNNGSIYIGQAIDVEDRHKDHVKKLIAGTHSVKMMRAFQLSGCILPSIDLLIDCHRDYLDLFESYFIHANLGANSLNTAIPQNLLQGATQRTIDVLVNNRNNSFVGVVDKLACLVGKIEGLKVSLSEAEEEIESLETKRSAEEIEKAGKARIRELQTEIAELERMIHLSSSKVVSVEAQREYYKQLYENEVTKSFWRKLFG